jgi:predicted permease
LLAVGLGLVFFLFSVKLPGFVTQSVSYLASVTTPISLLCVGFMLSRVKDWRGLWKRKQIFVTCGLQLFLAPTLAYCVLWLLGMPEQIRQIFTLIQALPTATSLAIFAEKYGGDKAEASEIVLISTMMSVITLPLVMSVILW